MLHKQYKQLRKQVHASKILVISISLAFILIPGRAEAIDMDTNSLISVTKQVIRAAAKVGIDEAGTRIMGSAWNPFKTMIAPVFNELEKRYPKFFLLDVQPGTTPSTEAQLAANNAVHALNSDIQLQKLLINSFNRLEEGQYEIRSQINRLTLRLEAIGLSLDQLSESNDKHFDNVMHQLGMIQHKLDDLGESVGLSNQTIIFPLTLELSSTHIESNVTIYIAGIDPIEIHVDRGRPFATVNVSVPKPGTYAYQLQHQDVFTLYKKNSEGNLVPELVGTKGSESGHVDIEANRVYELEATIVGARDMPTGTAMSLKLTKVLTPDEEAIELKKEVEQSSDDDIKELFRLLEQDQKGKP